MEKKMVEMLKEAIEAKCPASLDGGLLTLENRRTLDLMELKQSILKLMHANMALVEEFTTGACYDTKNPYRRKCVVHALGTMGEMLGHSDPITADRVIKEHLEKEGVYRLGEDA